MISLKYCGVFLILFVLGVVCPPCYNCPSNVHRCSGQGYYSDNVNGGYPGYNHIPLIFCPTISCSNPPIIVRNCTDDNDCLRKEKCCINPCNEGKKTCIVGVHLPAQMRNCPIINNCKKWLENHDNATICSSDDDCVRSRTCCTSPCITDKVCLKSKRPYLPFTTTTTGKY